MSATWQKIAPHIDSFVHRLYRDRKFLAEMDLNTALLKYGKELIDFAQLIDMNVGVETYFIPGTSHLSASAPVRVTVEKSHVSVGIQESFFKNDIPGSAKANRLLIVMIVLTRLAQAVDGEILDFTIGLMDEAISCDIGMSTRDRSVLLIPDSEFLSSGGYAQFREALSRKWVDWSDRMEIVMWRGATTGIQRPRSSYKSATEWYKILARTEVCARLKNEPFRGRCNVGISSILQLEDLETIQRIERELTRPFVSRVDQIGFRYFLDIDGNTNAWAGLMQSMLLGGCVVKVASENGFRQWYYDGLEAGQNCIFVKSDLSDLEETIDRCLTDIPGARMAATEGHRLAEIMNYEAEISATVGRLIDRFSRTPSAEETTPSPPIDVSLPDDGETLNVPLRLPNGSATTIGGSKADISVVATLVGNGGVFEPYLSAVFHRLVKPDWVCLDIGANIGAHSLGLASLAADVVALEPDPGNFRHLSANVQRSRFADRITLVEAAAWDENKELVIASAALLQGCAFITADDASHTATKLRAANPNPLRDKTVELSLRPTKGIKLDDLPSIQNLHRLDLVKIDVEGAETKALAGAHETLARFKPILVTEYNPDCAVNYFGQAAGDYFFLLASIYSKIMLIEQDGSLSEPIGDWEALSGRLSTGKRWEDLICLP